MKFHETKLDNGLSVIAELNPSVLSVAAAFFVRTGARDESAEVSGVSHFLEHMAFKGDGKHSADDVNRIFDEVGARYNASTSEETTMFYAAVLPEYLPTVFEVLAGLLRPSIREADFEVERKVILEEIGMYEDQPSFIAYESAMKTHFKGHPLGQSILGSKDSISALKRDQMARYHDEHYRGGNITIAVAGNADWEQVVKLAKHWCGDWPAGRTPRPADEARPKGGRAIVAKESSTQQHVMQMAAAPSATSPLRLAAEVLSVIVGDDSGSRLYWDLVDPGLAESADLSYNEYDGSGAYLTYLCSTPESTADNLERIAAIYADVNEHGVTEEELVQAQNKVASRIVLRSERPMGRLSSLGSNWVYRGEYRSVQDDLESFRQITTDDIRNLLATYPLGQLSTAAVGPLATL
ncbi:MAG TPA: pitrilysin family protein [Planctomycetaceae bacterium]|nr:pitrilysin family protein [Planctomycetaceae bacterium]